MTSKRDIIEKGLVFLNNNPKIIQKVYKTSLYNDEPPIYQYVAYINDKYGTSNSESVACGTSFNKKVALRKLFGEIVERYALSVNNNKRFIKGSYDQLGNKAINPKNFISFSKVQIEKYNFKDVIEKRQLYWVYGSNLHTGKKILIPAQLIFVPYVYTKKEPLIRFQISTGAATGLTLKDAIYSGICEVIERDSFMISYLNKIKSPNLNSDLIKYRSLQKIISKLNRYRLIPYLIDLTSDIQVPTIAAILVDKTGKGPAISLGLKSGLEIKKVIIGAIEEALMTRSWIRDSMIRKDKIKATDDDLIHTITDRALFWSDRSMIKHLDFWLKNNNRQKFKDNFSNKKDKYDTILDILKKNNIEAFYVDIATKEMKKMGIYVVKVIIPTLHPLYLDERYKYFGGKRLFFVPVKLGFSKRIKKENDLNKIPHPFL